MAKGKGKDTVSESSGEAPGFEASLERLEEIVAELEESDVPLERALELFEEGVRLGRACSTRLDEAEKKIAMLLERADGSLGEEPMDAGKPAAKAPAPRVASRKPAPADDDDGVPF